MLEAYQALNEEIIDDLQTILGGGFGEIVEEQVIQAREYMKDMQQNLKDQDSQKMMRNAHALKSSAGQIGLEGIHLKAKEIETLCREDIDSGSPMRGDIAEKLALLQDAFDGAVAKLKDRTANG
ncbi:MAG: Hpt domain-containing protein [Rickettsiales bacterium]